MARCGLSPQALPTCTWLNESAKMISWEIANIIKYRLSCHFYVKSQHPSWWMGQLTPQGTIVAGVLLPWKNIRVLVCPGLYLRLQHSLCKGKIGPWGTMSVIRRMRKNKGRSLMSDSWFCWSFNTAQIPKAPGKSTEIFFSRLMMFEAIFLVADNCTPTATKKSLMNLQKRMALMKMKASLPATLPANTKKEEIKKRKDKVTAAWRDFRSTTGSAKRKKRRKERKKKPPSLGFFYRTILHCCWVCIKWCSWLKEEGFWVEGNTEIYIFNGLVSSWREKWRAVKILELKSSSDSKSLECCIASGDCQLSAISTPFVILFVWEQTVYHLIRFITNAEQDCTENTETCTVRLGGFYRDLFQDSKTLIS